MVNFFNISYCSDRYQYTMGKTFFDEGLQNKRAVFNLFYRSAPDKNNWAVVSGVEEALLMISGLGSADIEFFERFLPGENYREYREYLSKMRFTGNVYAMEEGEIAFPSQPIIIVEGPLIEAQVLETPLLSIMNHQMAIATKASRVTRSTTKPVSEFGSRRAHGPWAAVYGAKAAYIGGCNNSSNIITGDIFGITSTGTMAHSYINVFGCTIAGELKAFETYIRSHFGEPLVLLVDTYDTLRCGLKNAIKAYRENGVDDQYQNSYGIRLDSGDLTYLSTVCREELNKAGLTKCKIFATNSLDEYIIAELERQGARIDAYGVGDAIATSKHNPCFGNVYKLVEIDGEPVLKRSEDKSKAINPGSQITYRIIRNDIFKADVTCLRNDSLSVKIEDLDEIMLRDEFDDTKSTIFKKNSYDYKILQNIVLKNGEVIYNKRPISERRDYYLKNLASLNETQRRLINPHFYKVDISDDLYDLKNNLINSLVKEIKEQENE
jgi:nicotinate phosphoribosyltransferase